MGAFRAMNGAVSECDNLNDPRERAELRSAARELVPLRSSHAAETERLRDLAPPVDAALRAGGFYTLTAPRKFGGREAGVRTIIEVYSELGRGCGSSAWVGKIHCGAAFMASLFGDEARQEIWGEDSRAAVSASLNGSASNTAQAVRGGFTVSGEWRYASPSMLGLSVAGPVIGMARGSLEHVMSMLEQGRPVTGSTYTNAIDFPSVQLAVADVASLIDTAQLHAYRAADDQIDIINVNLTSLVPCSPTLASSMRCSATSGRCICCRPGRSPLRSPTSRSPWAFVHCWRPSTSGAPPRYRRSVARCRCRDR